MDIYEHKEQNLYDAYRQQVTFCNKPNCGSCREGIGHGPYWYGYRHGGGTQRVYIGKSLPPDIPQERIHPLFSESLPHASNGEHIGEPELRVYTLGQWRVSQRINNEQEWCDITLKHLSVRRLLQYMLSNARRAHREQVEDQLWPHLDASRGKAQLHTALHKLRKAVEGSTLFVTVGALLTLSDPRVLWVDADVFDALFNRAFAVQDIKQKEHILEKALDLYHNAYLIDQPGTDAWLIDRREVLQRRWITAVLAFVDIRTDRDIAALIPLLERVLCVDPLNEAVVKRLISILSQLNRRNEAVALYGHFRDQLQAALHLAPLQETQDLFRMILGEQGRGNETKNELKISSLSEARWHRGPMVGRTREMDRIMTLIEQREHDAHLTLTTQKRDSKDASNHYPQSLIVMGEVGIGKTRLAEEVGRKAKQRGWVVAWSRAYFQEGTIPYRLWIEVLRKIIAHGAGLRQEISKRPRMFQPLSNLLPELQGQSQSPLAVYSPSRSPEQEQLRLWEAIKEFLILISESSPILIVLDDLHWADPSSCDLLAYLVRRLSRYSIVIVGTCRNMELAQTHPLRTLLTELRREQIMEALVLDPLSEDQVLTIVTQVIQVPEWLVQKITSRAAGNPFFAQELAHSLHEHPELSDSAEQDGLPETISAALALRLDHLSKPCQQLLSNASALGGSFTLSTISALYHDLSNSRREDEILDLLDEALGSGMLNETGQGFQISYQFWHPLLADHLYSCLSAARRAKLHRQAANVFINLATTTGREEEAATITSHLVQGGGKASTIAHYAERAGNYAYAVASFVQAAIQYRIAIEYGHERQSTWQHHSSLLARLSECLRIQGNAEEAARLLQHALDISVQYNQDASIDQEQEAQRQAHLWERLAHTRFTLGDLSSARTCCIRGEETLSKAGIDTGSAKAKLMINKGFIHWREGNFPVALRCAQEAYTLFSSLSTQQAKWSRSTAEDQIDMGRALNLLASVKSSMGYSLDGLPHLTEALEIFQRYDCAREIAIVSCNLGDIYMRIGDYRQAEIALDRCLKMAERVGDGPLKSFVFANRGIIFYRCGEFWKAEVEYRKSVALAEQFKDLLYLSWWNAFLAQSLVAQDKLSEAKSVLLKTFKLVRASRVGPYVGYALMVLGYLRLAEAQASERRSKPKLYLRARRILQLALTFSASGLEADTIIEIRLFLAEVSCGLGDVSFAHEQAVLAYNEAQQFCFRWHQERSQEVLDTIKEALPELRR